MSDEANYANNVAKGESAEMPSPLVDENAPASLNEEKDGYENLTNESTDDTDDQHYPQTSTYHDALDEAKSDANKELEKKSHGKEERVLFNILRKGFEKLRDRRFGSGISLGTVAVGEPKTNRPANSSVLVSFIDPTTVDVNAPASGSPVTGTSTQKFRILGQLSSSAKSASNEKVLALNLFEKFTAIFERDYASTLHSVAYENVRSGAAGFIESLHVRPELMRNYSAATASSGDPAEWHNGSYCHVYIAACESLEHYKGNVKPALQSFVSQIEGVTSGGGVLQRRSSSDEAATGGHFSPHYVIVYVPVGPRPTLSNVPTPPTSGEGLRGSFAMRMAAARRQLQQSTSRELNDSVHSQATSNTDGTDSEMDASEASAIPSGSGSNVSKVEKDIYRRLTTDFPGGKTCIMTTLMDSSVDGENEESIGSLRSQEWSEFLSQLGSAIVSGFKDRFRRYDEELRRLDAQRASVKASDSVSLSSKAVGRNQFDFSLFFCVKESLAFTFEQMQLPSEALLQYEELRAFVPEATEDDAGDTPLKHGKSLSWKKAHQFEEDTISLAVAGDTVGFRSHLRSAKDVSPVAHVVYQYIFSREASLLFQTGDAVEVVKRALSFVENAYQLRLKSPNFPGESIASDMEQRKKAESWAVRFCWDVKCACDTFFEAMNQENNIQMKRESSQENHVEKAGGEGISRTELARCLWELLGYARLRYLNLGDLEFGDENTIRSLTGSLPPDLKRPWIPWNSMKPASEVETGSAADSQLKEIPDILDRAFASHGDYEDRYLSLAVSAVALGRYARRRRSASRLQGEIAEIFIRRGNYYKAVELLLPILDVPALDLWDRGHYWRLFRLACCQRMMKRAPPYLNTLTRCFGKRLSPLAPARASEMLQQDLEEVICDPEISQFRLGVAPFLDIELLVKATSTAKSPLSLEHVRKRVLKNFCAVGEKATVVLTVSSHLPKIIEVDSMVVHLLHFHEFESVVREKADANDVSPFAALTLDSPLVVSPGVNRYSFEWVPMTTGQFIVSTVQLQWRRACFYYDCAALRQPLMEIDVMPSDPTHTVELSPLFLIPGHVQQIRIVFSAGSDVITSGTVQLQCSEGLFVVPPGMNPSEDADWGQFCQIELPACRPGETVVLTTSVKSNVLEGIEQKLGLNLESTEATFSGAVQTLKAKVATSYHHQLYRNQESKDKMSSMKAILETTVSTLDRPALTVDSVDMSGLPEERFMLGVNLHCNTPDPFSIKEWELHLPKLLVDDNGDLNGDMFGYDITEGDQLCFGFACIHSEQSTESKCDEELQPMLNVILQDQFGKTFNQVLCLNLVTFYEEKTRRDDFACSNSAMARMECSATEGIVGAPVKLLYHVDTSTLSGPRRRRGTEVTSSPEDVSVLYRISCVASDWIVGGNVQGLLQWKVERKFCLEFVGIPSHPGVLKSFPSIALQFKASSGETIPINVHIDHPECFTSLPFVNHMALACPNRLNSNDN